MTQIQCFCINGDLLEFWRLPHSEIVCDSLSFSLNRRLRVGIWRGGGEDSSPAGANLELTRVLIPVLWHSPSSL